jgi:hypothetical protein
MDDEVERTGSFDSFNPLIPTLPMTSTIVYKSTRLILLRIEYGPFQILRADYEFFVHFTDILDY